MRPCRATRAGTQAPPLPTSIKLLCHATFLHFVRRRTVCRQSFRAFARRHLSHCARRAVPPRVSSLSSRYRARPRPPHESRPVPTPQPTGTTRHRPHLPRNTWTPRPGLVPSTQQTEPHPKRRAAHNDRRRYCAPPSQPGRKAKASMLRLYPISRFRSTR